MYNHMTSDVQAMEKEHHASCCFAGRVRSKEAANIAKMNLIRGTNMALQFAVLPIAAFITFSVVRRNYASATAAVPGA